MLVRFELAMAAAGEARPESTLYFDDSTRNVAAGAEMGLYAVMVGRRNADVGADLEARGGLRAHPCYSLARSMIHRGLRLTEPRGAALLHTDTRGTCA